MYSKFYRGRNFIHIIFYVNVIRTKNYDNYKREYDK